MLQRRNGIRSQFRGSLESLEAREVPSAGSFSQGPTNFVYTETENTNPGQNAVIAYEQSKSGQLTEIGSFNTGGTGVANTGLLGPQDSDKEVIASADGRLLFAVNQGSNTIAVFRVHGDGSLKLINDSAFSSGGTE